MKKLFKDRKLTRKRVLEFLDKKGFYIVLILCVAIVGATAIFVTTHNVTSSNEGYDINNIIGDNFEEFEEGGLDTNVGMADDTAESIGTSLSTSIEEINEETEISQKDDAEFKSEESQEEKNKDGIKDKEVGENPSEGKQDKTNADTQASNDKITAENGITEQEQAVSKSSDNTKSFIMPVVGSITFDFAMDRLVYSKTLEDWRTHSGLDLAAERGTNVKVVADGFISEIKKDPRFGITIIVDHQNGLKTVYSNLASEDAVSPNQKVKQGEIIGAVGNTALFESAEESHLHFEVLKDNKPVDPKNYIPSR